MSQTTKCIAYETIGSKFVVVVVNITPHVICVACYLAEAQSIIIIIIVIIVIIVVVVVIIIIIIIK